MTDDPTGALAGQTAPTCYRHHGIEAHVLCQRCGRNICANCMTPASVGFQCPDCVKAGARTTRQARTPYGGLRPSTVGFVTRTLIAMNVAVFVLVLASGGDSGVVLTKIALIPLGAQYFVNGELTFVEGIADGAAWQLVTSMFTHVELWHIAFNMLALYVLGPQLEAMLGRARFLALYLLSGLTGSVTVYWLADEYSVTVGASGALFGLMAALLVVAIKVKGDVQSLLVLVAINIAITVFGRGYISWQGHLGGFVGGLLVALVLVYAPRRRRTHWQVIGMGVVAGLILVAVVSRTLALAPV